MRDQQSDGLERFEVLISAKLPKALAAVLQRHAQQSDRTVSAQVRHVLRQWAADLAEGGR